MTVFPNRFDRDAQPWLASEDLLRIMRAIAAGGGEARIVGGAVRDALLGRAVGEVDLAVNLAPDQATVALNKAGIKVVPTGIEHGTVTAVVNGKGFEITSLRRDVETDGRHAKVAFTNDWQQDAARRDFTFNALYADASGTIYDYFNGRDDLAQGYVRFIGEARERIREDVLRILRFFRFYAWFGKGVADAEALSACRDLAGLLPQLSVERVWRELVKLLNADDPLPALELMRQCGVLHEVLPEATDSARLKTLLTVEAKHGVAPSAMRRLAALLPRDVGQAAQIAKRLKLSKREADRLWILAVSHMKGALSPEAFRSLMYQIGPENARDELLLNAEADANLGVFLEEQLKYSRPVFPIGGEDLLKLGIKPGPEMGTILHAVEDWWIAQDFHPDRAACLDQAKDQIGKKP
jgi:poly(A) polymerase